MTKAQKRVFEAAMNFYYRRQTLRRTGTGRALINFRNAQDYLFEACAAARKKG